METLTIQIIDSKALKLLQDLENLDILKILIREVKTHQKLSDKYGGKLPSEIADELQQHLTQSRSEWNNVI